MAKKPRQSTPPRIDQNFLDMMNPVETFDIMGLEVNARALTIHDFGELKTMFKSWQSLEVNELLNSDGLQAFSAIIWLGTRKDTPELSERANVDVAVNMRTLTDWRPVITYISGVVFQEDEDALPPEPEQETPQGNAS